jgi:predicted metalloprotease with PDZ domain
MRLRISALVAAGLAVLLWIQDIGPGAQQTQTLPPISYRLAMPRPASHLFEVTIDVQVPPQAPAHIDFQMPKWQPGRYAVADFAKNVQEFRARSGQSPLPFSKTDDQTWRVQTLGKLAVTVTYRVFGNYLSGTFAQLDAGHANYNGG